MSGTTRTAWRDRTILTLAVVLSVALIGSTVMMIVEDRWQRQHCTETGRSVMRQRWVGIAGKGGHFERYRSRRLACDDGTTRWSAF